MQSPTEIIQVEVPERRVKEHGLQRLRMRDSQDLAPRGCDLEVALLFTQEPGALKNMPGREQRQEVWLVDDLLEAQILKPAETRPVKRIDQLRHDTAREIACGRQLQTGSRGGL